MTVDVVVRLKQNEEGNLRAHATLLLGDLLSIQHIKIFDDNGEINVVFPCVKMQGRNSPAVSFRDKEMKEKMDRLIIEEYQKKVNSLAV